MNLLKRMCIIDSCPNCESAWTEKRERLSTHQNRRHLGPTRHTTKTNPNRQTSQQPRRLPRPQTLGPSRDPSLCKLIARSPKTNPTKTHTPKAHHHPRRRRQKVPQNPHTRRRIPQLQTPPQQRSRRSIHRRMPTPTKTTHPTTHKPHPLETPNRGVMTPKTFQIYSHIRAY